LSPDRPAREQAFSVGEDDRLKCCYRRFSIAEIVLVWLDAVHANNMKFESALFMYKPNDENPRGEEGSAGR
jgi:hypothetical protein